MFDFHFDWSPELNVGISMMDEQHKEFFRIGRDMEQLLQFKCIGVSDKQLLDIVCELRDFVNYHFYEEERLMEKAGYAGLEDHRKQHRAFRKYVVAINCPALKEKPDKELGGIKEHVQDFIFQHVMVEDKKMAAEIKNKIE